MEAFLYAVAGVVFGGIISAGISYYFARKSTREMRREFDVLIDFLEANGQMRVERNAQGEPTKLYLPEPKDTLTVSDKIKPQVTRGDEE